MGSYQEMSPRNEFFPHEGFESVVMDGNYAEEFYLHLLVSKTYYDSLSREALAKAENAKVETVKANECGQRIYW